MERVHIETNAGGWVELDEDNLGAFGGRLRGQLIRPWDGGYEAARKL